MNGESYWLILEPYTYINLSNKSELLLYNEFNNQRIVSDNPIVYDLVSRLAKNTNLGSVELTNEDLSILVVRQFIEKAREYYMLDIIPKKYSKIKPVQFLPLLNFQSEKNRSKEEMVLKDVMYNLTELYFLLGSYNDDKADSQMKIYLQLPFFYNDNCNIHLSLKKIRNFFVDLGESSLNKIHLIGHNLVCENKYKKLLEFFIQLEYLKIFYFHVSFLNSILLSSVISLAAYSNIRIVLIIDSSLNLKQLEKILSEASASNIILNYKFIIKNIEEYTIYSKIIDKLQLDTYEFAPIFTGNNIAFLEEYVYTTLDDLNEMNPSMLEIKKNGKLNSILFGKLFVSSNNNITTNVLSSTWAKLGESLPNKIILNEILKGDYWNKVRNNYPPCDCCNFNEFCSPLSNYELAIGRYNLCHVRT